MSETRTKYDKNKNRIYYQHIDEGIECWCKYDKNNNLIYKKYSNGFKEWYKYDENNNLIYFKNSNDFEYWYKRDNYGLIKITKQEFENIKIKEYNSRTKCSRFELIDI